MTKHDIVERYLDRIGFHRTQGDTFEPVAHVFILDLMLQIHNKFILPYKDSFRHETARHRNEWIKAYSRFNKRFFNTFTPDEQDEICDIMDDFERYMGNHIEIARIAVHSCFKDYPFEEAKLLSAISMCNTLCHAAQASYGRVFARAKWDKVHQKVVVVGEAENQDIKQMIFHSIRMMNQYNWDMGHRVKTHLASEQAVKAIENLARKIYDWLGEIDKEN